MPQAYGRGQERLPASEETPDATGGGTAEVAVPGGPEGDAEAAVPETGLNLPLLAVFALILALVAASNLWLRRRALRTDEADEEPR